MEEQDGHQDNPEAESFYTSEMHRLGLNVEIAEPHLFSFFSYPLWIRLDSLRICS